jgi:hypothetical protein
MHAELLALAQGSKDGQDFKQDRYLGATEKVKGQNSSSQ